MRRAFKHALLSLMLITGSASAADSTAPDWTLETADGRAVVLSEVLFFWATWCPFCKALMPHLQSIDHELGESVEILALNFRDDGDPAGYIRERGYSFTLLQDAGPVAELYGVHGTPGVIIIDRDRMIRFNLYDLERPEIPATVRERGRGAVAAYLSAYWAAAIRRNIDNVL